MLTQDAMLFDRVGLSALVAPFYDKTVGASFGRHLPRVGADPIEAHARLFNYPVHSRVVGAEDIPELGIKAAAISNSFAAYRMTALDGVGGFPTDVILCEDVYVAAKMLMSGWKIAYCGNAVVRHSHDYSWWQEFKRYFDIGVFHSRERWILERFGKPQGEGARFVKSEIKYVWQTAPRLIVPIVFRTASKILGYHLGRVEGVLPVELKRRFSMHSAYWERKRTGVVVG
jgi:rhamnosyltransferase